MKKLLSIMLCAALGCAVFPVAAFAKGGYRIVSPYEDVIWDGENAWGAYKGNLHTHSTVSDAEMDFNEMILEHYRQGFDFLAVLRRKNSTALPPVRIPWTVSRGAAR